MLRRVLLIVLMACQLTAGMPVSLAGVRETAGAHEAAGVHETTGVREAADVHETTGVHEAADRRMARMDMSGMDMTGMDMAGMDMAGMDMAGMDMSHCPGPAQHQHPASKHGCCSDGSCQCTAPAALPAATPPMIFRVRPPHMSPESDIGTRALRIDLFLRPPIA